MLAKIGHRSRKVMICNDIRQVEESLQKLTHPVRYFTIPDTIPYDLPYARTLLQRIAGEIGTEPHLGTAATTPRTYPCTKKQGGKHAVDPLRQIHAITGVTRTKSIARLAYCAFGAAAQTVGTRGMMMEMALAYSCGVYHTLNKATLRRSR